MRKTEVNLDGWGFLCNFARSFLLLIMYTSQNMDNTSAIIDSLVRGLQERKGRNICVVDLSQFDTAPAQAFVLATGGSPQQVDALSESAAEFCRKELGEKPSAVAGLSNAQWVAMDFGSVILHIFLPAEREFYDLEHLWDDAVVTHLPDLD